MDAQIAVGILFADIVGSTQLYERLGDKMALSIVHDTVEAMSDGVAAQGGTVVKTIGDEVMAAFTSPEQALAAAIDILNRVATLPPLPAPDRRGRVQVRIGLHFGPAVQEEGDYFGDAVNIAARVVHLANPDQILITGELLDLLPPEMKDHATEFAEVEVKGRREPVRIAQVTVGEASQETTHIGFSKAAPSQTMMDVQLTLTFHGQQWPVPSGTRRLVIGRDPACDVVLAGGQISRQHASIEFRRGKVVLIDHSSNGTTLVVRDERPVRLLREEFGMLKGGHIILGRLNEPGAVVIGFAIT